MVQATIVFVIFVLLRIVLGFGPKIQVDLEEIVVALIHLQKDIIESNIFMNLQIIQLKIIFKTNVFLE